MNIPQNAYPLTWPESWPRTKSHERRRARFENNTLGKCCDEAFRQVRLISGFSAAERTVISTNVQARLDGRPYANRAQPSDPGVALYFVFAHKPRVIACDKWLTVEDNLWAIVKHVEALRGQERWGCGSLERAFRGYMAIPEKTGGMSWWEELGVTMNASEDQVRDAYHAKAKIYHPDSGSEPNAEKMIEINLAYQMATSQKIL
jgi:hypothetical protein